jgi:hypothetical protein
MRIAIVTYNMASIIDTRPFWDYSTNRKGFHGIKGRKAKLETKQIFNFFRIESNTEENEIFQFKNCFVLLFFNV